MSGPGKIKIFEQSGQMVRARLYNFDIDRAQLKPQHLAWLAQNALPFLHRGGSLRVIGLASRSGAAGYNQALSRRRADAVIQFLRSREHKSFKVARNEALGEEAARLGGFANGREDERWRSVILSVWDRPEPPPPPPPAPPAAIPLVNQRRTTKIVLHEAIRALGMDENDRRADNYFNAGRLASQAAAGAQSIIEETFQRVPANFYLHAVRLARSEQRGSNVLSSARLVFGDIAYEWGMGRTQIRVIDAYSDRVNPRITLQPPESEEDWLEAPAAAFRRAVPNSAVDAMTRA